ncbi:MAG: DUF4339 domain-containing protein [Bdellovibrionaceae bacterium]|jgi:hypothetical protein|nr:DUF4339 domain-containing protein [Pseudobdellovibrionaceae bacterium]
MDSKNSNSQSFDPSEEWFVLKGESQFGPYGYVDMVKLLQQKLIFEFDFVWKASFSDWKRIADLDAFSQDKLKELQKESPEIADTFFRRHHRRAQFEAPVLIHDNQSIWNGTSVELSEGGAGVIMENSMCVPGDIIYLHFKPTVVCNSFNAVCEVVSKKYVKGVNQSEAPIRYGLKFIKINEETKKMIAQFSVFQEAA